MSCVRMGVCRRRGWMDSFDTHTNEQARKDDERVANWLLGRLFGWTGLLSDLQTVRKNGTELCCTHTQNCIYILYLILYTAMFWFSFRVECSVATLLSTGCLCSERSPKYIYFKQNIQIFNKI